MQQSTSVNMFDIARAAGVSQATVSRVLRQSPNVSAATRERVLTQMRKLGYMSNVTNLLYADQMRKLNFRVCLCSPHNNNSNAILELPYFKEMVFGIQDTLRETDTSIQLDILPPDTASFPLHSEDGIILLNSPAPQLLEYLHKSKVPCVIISDDVYTDTDDLITANNYYSCRNCCQKLISKGLRSFGFLLADFHAEHLDGFLGEMIRRKCTPDPELIHLQPEPKISAECVQITQHWLQQKKLPQVIVISFGYMAHSIQTLLTLHQVQIPKDIRFVTFVRDEYAKFPYTLIENHPREMGRQGALRLLHKCNHPDHAPLTLVIPNSCKEISP